MIDECRSYWAEHSEEAASVHAQLEDIKIQIAVLTAQKDAVKADLKNWLSR